jgi:hypothetical protein
MCVVVTSFVHDIIAPVFTLVGVYLGSLLAGKRDYRIACGDLRAAFSDLMSELRYGTATPAIVQSTARGHEEAIMRFQAYVHWWKSKDFDAAYREYQQRRSEAQAEASTRNITPNPYGEFMKSIAKLITYAK